MTQRELISMKKFYCKCVIFERNGCHYCHMLRKSKRKDAEMAAKNYKDISGLALILCKLSSRTVGLNPVDTGSSPVRGRGGGGVHY